MKTLKTIAAASALTLALASFSLPSMAAEKTAPLQKLQPATMKMHKNYKHRHKHHCMQHKAWRKSAARSWHRALRPARILNVDDARTVTQAALILTGNRDSAIQDIKPITTKRGQQAFIIHLSNQQSKQNKVLLLNSNSGRLINVTNKEKFANEKP